MNRASLGIWTFTGVVVVATLLAIAWLTRDAQSARQEAALIAAKQADLAHRVQTLPSGSPKLAANVPPPTDAAATSVVAKAGMPTEAERLQERSARRQAMIRGWTTHAYAPFFRAAMLSPTQMTAFENVVVSHWVRWSDTADVFFDQHLAENDPVVKAMAKTEWTRFTNEEREALGPDAFQQLQTFERQAAVNAATDAVAGLVFDTGEPLTPDRAAALTQTLAANSSAYKQGGRASLADVDATAVSAHLQNVLTPGQLEALQLSLAARKYGPEIGKLLQEAAKNAAPER